MCGRRYGDRDSSVTSFDVVLDLSVEDAESAVRAALAEHGFGVLTEIDMAAAFKAKLGVGRAPLKILGACNPGFAYEAVLIDPAAILALPCNVVLEGVGSSTRVAVADPRDLMTDVELSELAEEVAIQLQDVVATLQEISPRSP
jgi:uncharacterized protein (DUF302 family)